MADETSAEASANAVRWNARWAELAGVDGHLVTDLVGRRVPTLTAEQIDAMHTAKIDLGAGSNNLVKASLRAHSIADHHGLRAVAAVAARTAELAAMVHIAGELGTPEWHDSFQRTMAARDAARHTALALVVRQHARAELVDQLTAVSRAVMGPLRERIPLEPAVGDCACGRPPGDVVFTADAAQQVRTVQDGFAMSHQNLIEELAWRTDQGNDCHRTHISRDQAAHAIRTALDDAPGLSAATKAWLLKRLGLPQQPPVITSAASLSEPNPEQPMSA